MMITWHVLLCSTPYLFCIEADMRGNIVHVEFQLILDMTHMCLSPAVEVKPSAMERRNIFGLGIEDLQNFIRGSPPAPTTPQQYVPKT